MAYDIGPRISIAGEKEFNDQYKKIISSLKVLGSEMSALTKKFAQNEDSIESLSEKNALMQKQMDIQKQKLILLQNEYSKQSRTLEDLGKALDDAKEAYGENSVEANKAQNAYNKQQETLSKLNVAINETQGFIYNLNNQIDINAKKMDELASSQKESETAISRLTSTLENQRNELLKMINEYENVILTYGKGSSEAKELESKIGSLTSEYNENVSALNKVKKESQQMSSALDDVENGAKDAGDGFTIMKGAMADLTADAIVEIKNQLLDLATSSENASNQFAASTGASAEAMEEYNKEMQEMYASGYGESLEDIAQSMAEVKQQTKEIDSSNLRTMTEDAITLRDTFGFDVKESIRAAKMLMDQFGISGEEAFNLIAQGAQNGLDKNGDLLDSINEYSVHYKQLNFTAEEFFNSMINGAESGTFSVDKLGDAVKEFGIRVKDTADSTTEGFELIGLDANKMRKEFAKGGESASKAMDKTLKALFSVDDQVKQNQAGVDLFGTMWEDLGVEGVKALTNVSGTASRTEKTIESINDVKYNSVENEIEQLGRSLKTDLFEPTIKRNLPAIKDGIEWLTDNMPKLEPIIKGVGIALTGAFAVKKTTDLVGSITNLGTKLMDMSSTKIPAVNSAMTALGTALSSHPWIALGTAVAGVGVALLSFLDTESEATKQLKENADAARQNREAWDEMVKARDKAVADTAGEFDYYSRLKDELTSLVDQNGKVKKGYEDRVNYIVGALNDALGTEITLTGKVIENYKEQMTTIDQLIEKQRAKAIITANEESYQEAIKNQTSAMKELYDAEKQYSEYKQMAQKVLSDLQKQGMSDTQLRVAEETFWESESAKAVKQAYEDKKATVEGYTQTIAQQEYLQQLYAEGSAESIAEINGFVKGTYIDKGKVVTQTLQEQLAQEQQHLETLKELNKNAYADEYDMQIKESQRRIEQLKKDIEAQTSTINEGSNQTSTAWGNLSEKNLSTFSSIKSSFTNVAFQMTQNVKKGVNLGTKETNAAWEYLASQGYAKLDGKTWQYTDAGEQYIKGVKKGLENEDSNVFSAVADIGLGMISSLKESLDINSPSREAQWIAKMFDEGLIEGNEKNKKKVIRSISQLGNEIIDESRKINDEINFGWNGNKVMKVQQDMISNAYASLKNDVTIVVESILDGKMIARSTQKYITNEQKIRMMSRGY